MTHILVAEDEAEIADFIARGLVSAGYTVVIAPDGASALARALSGEFQVVLLDVGLPGLDGFEVLREIRGSDQLLSVIMLTARSAITDTVAGLDAGATDYISKPFRFEELLARIRLALRQADRAQPTELTRNGLTLDLRTRRANLEGRSIELSAREFSLTEELMRNPDAVVTRQHLLHEVWGFDHDPGSNILEVYVSYVREKLGADRIETVRGEGYRLR